jgi:nicotinamidase-related amidase
MRASSAALLVIDVQRGLFNRTTPIYQADVLLQNINMLIDCAHRSGSPVIFVQHSNEGFLARGTENWQLHPGLDPADADSTIHKRHGNAFLETPLKEELGLRGVHSLVVTGLVTHGCVQATCLGAKQLGYEVILVGDGHSNYHRQAEKVIEDWNQKLRAAGVELRSAREIDFKNL